MPVQITYRTEFSDLNGRMDRAVWLEDRVPSNEYNLESCIEFDTIGMPIVLETTVILWCDDADRVATEFWFKFP